MTPVIHKNWGTSWGKAWGKSWGKTSDVYHPASGLGNLFRGVKSWANGSSRSSVAREPDAIDTEITIFPAQMTVMRQAVTKNIKSFELLSSVVDSIKTKDDMINRALIDDDETLVKFISKFMSFIE